jgi:hypothetical protein
MINIDDGTKIRFTEDDEFSADFPESVDMKITNCCRIGCKMCHEESTENGEHADLNANFLNTLRPYTEMAIGGGSVTSHPEIDNFLQTLKEKRILPSMTLHEKELFDNLERIQKWIDDGLVKGVGISVCSPKNDHILEFTNKNNNAVLHVIAGHTPLSTITSYGNMNGKILILGYKNWGRGSSYFQENLTEIREKIKILEKNIDSLLKMFDIVSFDNLALEQLNVREHVDDEMWDVCYQGCDATHTMYIDLVKREFAATSTSAERYALKDTIDEMFAEVKGSMDHKI